MSASELYPEVVLDEVYFTVGKRRYPVYISLDMRYKAIEVLKDQGMKKDLDIQAIRKMLNEVLVEGMHNHDAQGVKQGIKEEFNKVTFKQIDKVVADNFTDFWTQFLEKSELVSKEKAEEIKGKMAAQEKESVKN